MIKLSGSLASILDSEEEDGISPEESNITDPEQVLEAFTLLLKGMASEDSRNTKKQNPRRKIKKNNKARAKAANAEGEGADVGEEGTATGEKTADTGGENTGNIKEAAAAGGESTATGEKTADIREENTEKNVSRYTILISYNSQGEDPI
ncbi:hypothetical protein BO71DRAFT_468416 [Aspergillus ellipticus CBS 707.79]|uniref:Uncharacterized protein n=1 Tax=Aspergillus ellipticus CBS 707.79 TaxID=1448320 RepID=A0A319DJV1_9EURO|nr:hypothetical protein BO71DRAFT_468416 [Aspergillus ellipticus CBS 707.79]